MAKSDVTNYFKLHNCSSLFYSSSMLGECNTIVSFIIGLIVFGVLDIRKSLRKLVQIYPVLPCSYKAEIIITPDYRELLNHEFAKGYYEKALPKVGREDMLINSIKTEVKDANENENVGVYSLWKSYELRFLIVNNMFGSYNHNTFLRELRFHNRILDYDFSKDEKEPNWDIEVKNGFLRFWFSSPEILSKIEDKLICEFPLYIYDNIPRSIINMKPGSKGWQDYLRSISAFDC